MTVSDSDDHRLRDLEEHLAVDDAVFVDAFRSRRSSLMGLSCWFRGSIQTA